MPRRRAARHTRALVSGVQRSNDLSLGPTVLVRQRLLPFGGESKSGRKFQRILALCRGSTERATFVPGDCVNDEPLLSITPPPLPRPRHSRSRSGSAGAGHDDFDRIGSSAARP